MRPGVFFSTAFVLVAACTAPGGPDARDWSWDTGVPGPASPTGVPDGGSAPTKATGPSGPPKCNPAQSASPLPATATAISASAGSAPMMTAAPLFFTADLFGQFRSQCGACHVEGNQGGFGVTQASFPSIDDAMVIARIGSDDPNMFMPPAAAGGKAFSQRKAPDPVLAFLDLFKRWVAQGKPADAFMLDAPMAAPAGPSMQTYLMSPDLGTHLTNIGNCVPDAPMVAAKAQEMEDLDAKFAAMTALPESLADTDLTTFDAAALAADGVVAYAPTYPLWTDDAGKLRYVRVPHGQSIAFDKAKQQFELPANTRFYKTFLREIVDRTGNKAFRKIETRVIVSRPDTTNPDGTAKINALFGTYLWNDAETEAHLLQDPLRSGEPFRDRLLTVIIDEPKAQQIVDSHPASLTYALEEQNKGVVRHYAVPGRDRCIQCHMGSPSASFILGFTPLQVARRPTDTGGVYEPAGPDEQTQLQRLLDYKIISGMSSPADVLPLEASQGTRQPRTPEELKAQAYMVGNCSHCHNPRGFPSIKNPDLKPLLNFLPSTDGGIFQFPLDRMSPRLKRGADQNVAIPYITPSLRDYPSAGQATTTYKPKWIVCQNHPGFCADGKMGVEFVDAPWRSLIYRNVDNPFSYVDDYVVFPHMPMNSPGYDCRVAHLLGDWMVSIPARLKQVKSEDAVPPSNGTAATCTKCDVDDQPYVEVKPDEPDYSVAVDAAKKRLDQYHAGRRYRWCPENSDILDPEVVSGVASNDKDHLVPTDKDVYVNNDPNKGLFLEDNVPERPHWVVTDLTETPGDWGPRRADWADVLVAGEVMDARLTSLELDSLKTVVATVQTVKITDDLKSFALTEVPFGRWAPNPACDFRSVPKAADFSGDKRWDWLDGISVKADDPIYTQSPGGAIFGMICINCHGPQADAKGIQADAVLQMTGGETRVANLRDGLFGPLAMPGTNLGRVFTQMSGNATARDWAARYMSFMALGGTQRLIPQSILNIVGTTSVLGVQRESSKFGAPPATPNMLQVGQQLCHHVLPTLPESPSIASIINTGVFVGETALIDTNGDAEMWRRLCSLNNRSVVRVPYLPQWNDQTSKESLKLNEEHSLYWADAYPADAPVLDHHGKLVQGIHPGNLMPLCIRKPDDPAQAAVAAAFLKANPVISTGAVIPFCPPALFETTTSPGSDPVEKWLFQTKPDPQGGLPILVDADAWATRGAINAGFSVFLYLEQLESGAIKPKPRFNQCDQLPKAN